MFFSCWLRNRNSTRPTEPRRGKPPARFRPQLEGLDGRLLPSFVSGGGWVGDGVVAVGDFNNDKRLDIASVEVGDWGASTLHVQLGNRTGQFNGSSIATGIGSGVTSIAVGKFNSDKYLDIIVTNNDSNGNGSVRLYLGKGDGTFTPWGGYSVGGYAHAVAVGDFNGDNRLDAVAVSDSGTYVLLGDGKGGFKSVQTVGPGGNAVAVGDINSDGRLDIVAGTWSLLGNGDGTFQAAQNLSISGIPTSMTLADVNGDGKLDIVSTGNILWPETDVLLGKGDGTFGPAQNVGPGADAVAVADFNQDGKLDIVGVGNGYTFVDLGNGDGTFQSPLSFGFGGQGVAVGDLNGDGYPDLAIGSQLYINDGRW